MELKPLKVYVASSWRNQIQPIVVQALRSDGHEVYDFRNPKEGDMGFHWSEIDHNWKQWTPEKYRSCLNHPIAESGFKSDFDAMVWADVFVGVQPFGRSASLEMGWAAGQGKKTILLLENGEPELMVKMLDHICCSVNEVKNILNNAESWNTRDEDHDDESYIKCTSCGEENAAICHSCGEHVEIRTEDRAEHSGQTQLNRKEK